MAKTKAGRVIGGIIILVLIIGVFMLINRGPSTITEAESIKIGGLFGLTGYSAEWGEVDMNGVLLAFEEINAAGGINGRQIEFIIEDTKSDFTQTALALNKLINVDEVTIVMGPTWAAFSEVAIPIAEENKIVLMSASGGPGLERFESKYYFSTWPSSEFWIIKTVDFMVEEGYENTAIIFTQETWSQSVHDNFLEEAEKKGINILKSFETQPDEKDYRTIITRLKGLDIDSVFVPFASESEKGLFLKQSTELELGKQVFSTTSSQSFELINNYPQYAEGLIYAYPAKIPKEEDFLAKYKSRFGKEPQSPNAGNAYDAATAVILALQKNPQDVDEMINNLLAVDFDGASNRIRFNQFGQIVGKDFIMKTIIEGEFIPYEQ